MQSSKNICKKYLNRSYLWSRMGLGKHYRVSEWRIGGQIFKLYEKNNGLGWHSIHRVTYEIND